jgi:hypothetical protein
LDVWADDLNRFSTALDIDRPIVLGDLNARRLPRFEPSPSNAETFRREATPNHYRQSRG